MHNINARRTRKGAHRVDQMQAWGRGKARRDGARNDDPLRTQIEAGPWAIDQFLEMAGERRFIQSSNEATNWFRLPMGWRLSRKRKM